MSKPQNRKLGRVQYWQGQMLRSADFLDIERIEAQRRWWHNRAVHQAYGVYLGMKATQSTDSSGTAEILVTPGVAYDCFGRELVLECEARILFPSAPPSGKGSLTLLIRYRKPKSRAITDARAAVCCLADGATSAGTVEFIWDANQRVAPDEGVPLGHLIYSGRKFGRFAAFVAVPTSRPLARPRVAYGSTVPGNTAWQPWAYSEFINEVLMPPVEIGVQTAVDTSAAGFTEIPQYFAWLEGPIWNSQTAQLVPALLPSLASESINSFTFRLMLLPPPPPSTTVFKIEELETNPGPQVNAIQDSNSFSIFAQQQGLYVAWMGCQMSPHTRLDSQKGKTSACGRVFRPEVLHCRP
jgi:hypothetical protein